MPVPPTADRLGNFSPSLPSPLVSPPSLPAPPYRRYLALRRAGLLRRPAMRQADLSRDALIALRTDPLFSRLEFEAVALARRERRNEAIDLLTVESERVARTILHLVANAHSESTKLQAAIAALKAAGVLQDGTSNSTTVAVQVNNGGEAWAAAQAQAKAAEAVSVEAQAASGSAGGSRR